MECIYCYESAIKVYKVTEEYKAAMMSPVHNDYVTVCENINILEGQRLKTESGRSRAIFWRIIWRRVLLYEVMVS